MFGLATSNCRVRLKKQNQEVLFYYDDNKAGQTYLATQRKKTETNQTATLETEIEKILTEYLKDMF